MKKIAIVFGTRPEIIKLAEIIRLLKQDRQAQTLLVFTGQHYDYNLFGIFMKELELPEPDINLGIGSGSQGYQVGTILIKLEEFFLREQPAIVAALGEGAVGVIRAFGGVMQALLMIFVPATIIVAVKHVFILERH